MSIRVHKPDTVRLPLSGGDSILVKRYLTAGEHRAVLRASLQPLAAGETPKLEMDADAFGIALVLAYLLDWTFQDADGSPLVIADQAPETVRAVLERIDAGAYDEVQGAIQRHQVAMKAALEAEKKTATGVTLPDRILTSVG